MDDQTRETILKLRAAGSSVRETARIVGTSTATVQRVWAASRMGTVHQLPTSAPGPASRSARKSEPDETFATDPVVRIGWSPLQDLEDRVVELDLVARAAASSRQFAAATRALGMAATLRAELNGMRRGNDLEDLSEDELLEEVERLAAERRA